MKHVRNILLAASVALATVTGAQDIALTNPYFAPLLLGPAFAGGANTPRVNFVYKNQWPRIYGGFRETYISYDQPSQLTHGGLGGYYHQSRDTNGITYYRMYGSANFSAMSGNGAVRFVAGMEAGYVHGTLKFSEYRNAPEGFYRNETDYIDIGVSAAVHSQRYSFAAGVQHLNRPNTGFDTDKETRLPMKITVAAVAIIPVGGRYGESNISPMLYYTSQGDTQNLQLGFMWNKEFALFGIAYRNRSSFNVCAGIRFDRFRILYSFDGTVSSLVSRKKAGNAHEIGIMLYLKPQDDSKVFHSIEHNGFDADASYGGPSR